MHNVGAAATWTRGRSIRSASCSGGRGSGSMLMWTRNGEMEKNHEVNEIPTTSLSTGGVTWLWHVDGCSVTLPTERTLTRGVRFIPEKKERNAATFSGGHCIEIHTLLKHFQVLRGS